MAGVCRMKPLVERCRDRRVLFVTSIRSDVPSGGRTATATLLRQLQRVADVRVLSLAPVGASGSGTAAALCFFLASLPGSIFVGVYRRTGWPWLEFLTRISPWFAIRCWWARLRDRPQIVVLNHHATFAYGWLFRAGAVTVWHDVPSFKRDSERDMRRHSRICFWIERLLLMAARGGAITYSTADARVLRVMHGVAVELVPVIDPDDYRPRAAGPRTFSVLLVGNWNRIENSEGAAALFDAYLELEAMMDSTSSGVTFHVAGVGADAFVAAWRRRSGGVSLHIKTTASYADLRDFSSEMVMVAPLLRGAGIKLKTLEAWAAGLPVIGTKQAFTGLPLAARRAGGKCLRSVSEIARVCTDAAQLEALCRSLDPAHALELYRCSVPPHAASGMKHDARD